MKIQEILEELAQEGWRDRDGQAAKSGSSSPDSSETRESKLNRAVEIATRFANQRYPNVRGLKVTGIGELDNPDYFSAEIRWPAPGSKHFKETRYHDLSWETGQEKKNSDVAEGWGQDRADADRARQFAAKARVLQQYQDDPQLSSIAGFMSQSGQSAQAIAQTLKGQGQYDLEWWANQVAKNKAKVDPQHTQKMIDKYLTPKEDMVDEAPASRALCTSGKPDSALGASQLASCKSQGYRARDGGKSHKVGSERIRVRGKKIKGKKYGGVLPDYGSR